MLVGGAVLYWGTFLCLATSAALLIVVHATAAGVGFVVTTAGFLLLVALLS